MESVVHNIFASLYNDLHNPYERSYPLWIFSSLVIGLCFYWINSRTARSPLRSLAYLFPRSVYLTRSSAFDVLSIVTNLVFVQILTAFFFKSSTALALIERSGIIHFAVLNLNLPLRTGLGVDVLFSLSSVVVFDFAWYFSHRMLHRVPLLWGFHRVHHSATALNPLTANRVHIVEYLTINLFVGLSIGVTLFLFEVFNYAPNAVTVWGGLPFFNIFFLVFGNLRHSHVPVSFGRLSWVFSSPLMHQAHHSNKNVHLNKNYGFNLSLFDWLFSTLYIPQRGEVFEFGLGSEDSHDHDGSFFRLYFAAPLIYARKCLFQAVGSARARGDWSDV